MMTDYNSCQYPDNFLLTAVKKQQNGFEPIKGKDNVFIPFIGDINRLNVGDVLNAP